MTEREYLNIQIDILNALEASLLTAKHRLGKISDEEYEKRINRIQEMFDNSQERTAKAALKQLIEGFAEIEKETE